MVIVKKGSRWILKSRDKTKVLGIFKTRKEALERERQILYFKHQRKRK